MRVLLVGAGGFLGGALDRELSAEGHRLTRVVGPGRDPGPDTVPYRPGLYDDGDLLDQVDAVVYAAGRVLPRDGRDLRQAWEVDCAPLAALCAAAARSRRRDPPLPLLLLSSGGAIYGPRDRATRLTETDPLRPVSVYGQSRVFLEEVLRFAGRGDGAAVRPTVFRLSNLYGPGQDPDGGSAFVVRAVRAAAGGPVLPLMGSGRQAKDFLHVDDFTAAVGRWLEAIGAGAASWDNPRFNICSGESHTLRTVLDTLEAVTGRPVPVEPVPGADEDVPRVSLSPDKARRELGWRAEISLAEGLRRFWHAMQAP